MNSHNFLSDFERNTRIAKGSSNTADPLIAFDEAQKMSLLIRATAFVFSDPRSRELHQLIERIAPSEATVLITGETGTGKELVARHVHALSHRAKENFLAVNCGAFSETLIESELFGHDKGSFTGAINNKAGWFESANGGTLFLDEIGDLPMAMQVKLLRVLQEREVVRLGSRKAIPIDVRLIAATNVDLKEAVRAGHFREDLFYRLQVISLPLLPLRERPGDILPLAQHFLKTYIKRLHLPPIDLSADAKNALLSYPWPGNIRELENVIHRALLVSNDVTLNAIDLNLPGWHTMTNKHDVITFPNVINLDQHQANVENDSLNEECSAFPELDHFYQAWEKLLDQPMPVQFEEIQQTLVHKAWTRNQQNQVRSAKQLGISRNVLRTYLKKVGVI